MTALRKSVALIAMLAVLRSACPDAASSSGQTAPGIGDLGNAPAPPDLDSGSVEVGKGLYTELCASCHGADLAGDPDWKTPNPDGSYSPPPHDSTGHTWHHSDRLLVDIVRNGSGFEQSRMPTFSDLSVVLRCLPVRVAATPMVAATIGGPNPPPTNSSKTERPIRIRPPWGAG